MNTDPRTDGRRTRRRPRRSHVGALLIAGVFAISACGSDDESASAPADEQAADTDDVAIAGGDAEPETGGVDTSALPFDENRDFIRTVGLTVQTSHVDETAEAVRRIAAENGGGVSSSDVTISDELDDGSVPGGGQIVVRVEPDDLDRLVAALDGAGFVTRLSQDALDVTDQLVDLDIRIRQAETSVERVELLLAEATELGEVFAIESELTTRQVTLEQLRAQQRATDDLVALATVTIQIEYRTPAALEDARDGGDGIGDAFASGWDAFVGTVFAIGFVLAATAPFLISALFITAIAWLLGKRWARRQREANELRRQEADRRGPVTPPVPVAASSAPTAAGPPPPMPDQRLPDRPAAEPPAVEDEIDS